ncbi:MAG: hypothetical protein NTX35_22600 [Verrucomicrobia bacterium]|nr:hypothetical protein [Verrucomicrobiota bacterium]
MQFTANLQWIKEQFGGRTHMPVAGLRPMIRIQRQVRSWLDEAVDVSVLSLGCDPETWSGEATIKVSPNSTRIFEQPQAGELIELLDGYRVIAVGKVIR